jgi:hypothetical protein
MQLSSHCRETSSDLSFGSEDRNRRPNVHIIGQLWRFTIKRKRFWLLPLMIMAVVYGALAVFTKGSVLAPFIYTLF